MSYLVGITGGSASGKTRFINELLNNFENGQVSIFSQDNYYRDRHQQPKDENGIENFDTPESIDIETFKKDLKKLHLGEKIEIKEYTFNNSDKEAKHVVFNPAPIILAEGLFVFNDSELLNLFDLKIFIEADEPTKLTRRLLRDKNERGYDIDDVLYRYSRHVYPNYLTYVKPLQFKSDMIIPNNNSFEKALEVVISHLKTKI